MADRDPVTGQIIVLRLSEEQFYSENCGRCCLMATPSCFGYKKCLQTTNIYYVMTISRVKQLVFGIDLELEREDPFMNTKDPELMDRIKEFIRGYYREYNGFMPTITQISNAMGVVRSTAYKYLVAMDKKILISSLICQGVLSHVIKAI